MTTNSTSPFTSWVDAQWRTGMRWRPASTYAQQVGDLLAAVAPSEAADTAAGRRLTQWTEKLAGTPVPDLLADLHDAFGLQWSTIAKLLGVSVTAVNKWRAGGAISDTRNEAVRRLAGFAEIIVRSRGDVAGWLVSRPVPTVPLTRADVYLAGGAPLLIDNAEGQGMSGTALLDGVFPSWRDVHSEDEPRGLASVYWDEEASCWVATLGSFSVTVDGATREEAEHALMVLVRDVAAGLEGEGDDLARAIRASDEGGLRRILFVE